MQLIERRIGLLFALFLPARIGAAALGAWLGVVKADALKQAAATQQEATIDVPARRGSITDRTGIELAVSEPAMTIAATPYLIEDPPKIAAQTRAGCSAPRGRAAARSSRAGHRLRLPGPQRCPPSRGRKVQTLEDRGARVHPRGRRTYPRELLASQLLGSVGTDDRAWPGSSHRRTRCSGASTASACWSRTRSATRSS